MIHNSTSNKSSPTTPTPPIAVHSRPGKRHSRAPGPCDPQGCICTRPRFPTRPRDATSYHRTRIVSIGSRRRILTIQHNSQLHGAPSARAHISTFQQTKLAAFCLQTRTPRGTARRTAQATSAHRSLNPCDLAEPVRTRWRSLAAPERDGAGPRHGACGLETLRRSAFGAGRHRRRSTRRDLHVREEHAGFRTGRDPRHARRSLHPPTPPSPRRPSLAPRKRSWTLPALPRWSTTGSSAQHLRAPGAHAHRRVRAWRGNSRVRSGEKLILKPIPDSRIRGKRAMAGLTST